MLQQYGTVVCVRIFLQQAKLVFISICEKFDVYEKFRPKKNHANPTGMYEKGVFRIWGCLWGKRILLHRDKGTIVSQVVIVVFLSWKSRLVKYRSPTQPISSWFWRIWTLIGSMDFWKVFDSFLLVGTLTHAHPKWGNDKT